MADGKIVIDTSLDNRGFTKGIRDMKAQTNGLTSAVKRLGSVIASAFAVRAMVQFGRECVALGSNVAEVQNVVDVAFGDMSYKIEEFAQTSIQSFGMSQLAAKKTASTYMAMARGMGIGGEEASNMAISLAGLSGDVASFFNISQELADLKLKSIFTGETETLKDLGVVMTQANLKAYALSKGISRDISAMSQAELVGLRYQFVLDQLQLAQGDFARTSDSWANQTRILSMQWQELMSVLGQALIAVLTPLVQVLNQIVSGLISLANTARAVISSLFGGAGEQMEQTQTQVSGVAAGIASGAENQQELTEETKETAKAQKKLLAGFDELNQLSSGATSAGGSPGGAAPLEIAPLSPGGGALAGAGDGMLSALEAVQNALAPLEGAFHSAFQKIRQGWENVKHVFLEAWDDLSQLSSPWKAWFSQDGIAFLRTWIETAGVVIGGLLDSFALVFSDIWSRVIYPSLQKWAADILPLLTDIAAQFVQVGGVIFQNVKRIFDRVWSEGVAPALSIIQTIWSAVWDSIAAAWDRWGELIFSKVKTAIEGTGSTLENVWSTVLKPVWDVFMQTVDSLWDNHLQPLWDGILDLIGSLVEGALTIYNQFILPVANWLIDTFGPAWADGIGGAIQIVGAFLGRVADGAAAIIAALTGVIQFVSGIFTTDWAAVWEGIKGVVKDTVNGLIGMVESFVNFFVRGINRVIDSVNSLSFDVPDWVPGIGGETFGFNIPRVSEFSLPRLATGAVIPPNREFLAVLGDQKSGTNIETPLSTMVQAFKQALNETGYSGGRVIENVVLLDGEVIYRNQQKISRQHGMSFARG